MNIATGEKSGVFSLKDFQDLKTFRAFGAQTKDEYLTKLSKMNLADIHAEAIKHGIRPNYHRATQIKALLIAFTKSAALSAQILRKKEK